MEKTGEKEKEPIMELIDFTNCKIDNTYLYRGANGNKIGIEYQGHIYMLKFPAPLTNNEEMSYSNSCISEYISCHILESMGFRAQETILGKYFLKNGEEKIVCACKDFTEEGCFLEEFASLKNSIVDSPNNGYGTDLKEVLDTIQEQNLLPSEELHNFFWDLFIADAFLGNFDRHNGNWGFLIYRQQKTFAIAPIFDCGSCLYPQLTDEQMEEYLNNQDEIDKRVYVFPNSALKINDKKINYYEYINSLENESCTEALMRVFPKIDLEKINHIVEETPGISDVRKRFYQRMLKERYEKILKVAYDKLFVSRV